MKDVKMKEPQRSSRSRKSTQTDASSSNINTDDLLCLHSLKPVEFTSMTDENPARRFVRCPLQSVDDCGFWLWIDDPLQEFQRECFLKLKAERDKLNSHLDCKLEKEKYLSGRLIMKESGILDIEGNFDELCCRIVELEYQLEKYKQKAKVEASNLKNVFSESLRKKDARLRRKKFEFKLGL